MMPREIVTRAEALERGLDKYFTGNPCKNGHISERYLCWTCVACRRERKRDQAAGRRWKAKNPEKVREIQQRYYAKNKDTLLRKQAERRASKPEQSASYRRRYKDRHRDKVREKERERARKMRLAYQALRELNVKL